MMDKIAQRVHEMANILMDRTLLETAHKALADGVTRYVWEPHPLRTSIEKNEGRATITITPKVEVSFERPAAEQCLLYRQVCPVIAQILVDEAQDKRLAGAYPALEPVQGLDPGVATLVNALRELGHRTCDSGDGKSKFESGEIEPGDGMHLPFAHVFVQPPPDCDIRKEVERLTTDLAVLGQGDWEVQATYADGLVLLQANEPIPPPEWASRQLDLD